jgi:hypothetical protein
MHISTSLHTSSSLLQKVLAYANFNTIISIVALEQGPLRVLMSGD